MTDQPSKAEIKACMEKILQELGLGWRYYHPKFNLMGSDTIERFGFHTGSETDEHLRKHGLFVIDLNEQPTKLVLCTNHRSKYTYPVEEKDRTCIYVWYPHINLLKMHPQAHPQTVDKNKNRCELNLSILVKYLGNNSFSIEFYVGGNYSRDERDKFEKSENPKIKSAIVTTLVQLIPISHPFRWIAYNLATHELPLIVDGDNLKPLGLI